MIRMLGCLCAAALLNAGDARAADPTTPAAAVPGSQLSPGVGSSSARLQVNAVRVERVAFRGNRALHVSALQAVAAPYLGRELSGADIEELKNALTRRYTDHGYINSAVVLDPDVPYHDGVLGFLVIEGRLQEVRVRGLNGLHSSYVVDRLRGSGDEALNIDVLRARFQRLADDPLFARVNSSLEAGADLADAILDVDVQRARPYSLTVALNNYRPAAIGEKAYDVSGQAHNLTGFGDVLDADLSGPIESSGGVGYGLDWQLPVGHYGTLVAASAARINTVVTEEPLSALDLRSTIERQELKLTQPWWSSLRQEFSLGAGIAHEQESTLGNELVAFFPGFSAGATRAVTARLIPDYNYRSEQQYFDVRLTLLHANLLDDASGPMSASLPDQKYFVWSGQMHHLWEFAHAPFELESRAIVQRTNAHISDLHALTIGGINSVRGFRENEFLASNVENLNVDFRWLALPVGTSLRPGVRLGTFFDWAAGYDVGEHTDTFSSCGLTLRLKWSRVQADLAYGLPLIHPAFVSAEHGSWQDHGIHAQISTTL
jgi:hemolysin activation/secretion protein